MDDNNELISNIDALFKRAQTIVTSNEDTASKQASPYKGALDAATLKSIAQRDAEMLELMKRLSEKSIGSFEQMEKELKNLKNTVQEIGDFDDEEVVMGIIAIKGKLDELSTKVEELETKQTQDKEEVIEKMRILFNQSKGMERLVLIGLISSLVAAFAGIAGIIINIVM